jgi:FdhD protein
VLDAVRTVGRTSWRGGALEAGERAIPEETAIAFTFNGSSYAVMMATPRDLEDFAVGFSLTEGIIGAPRDIESLEIIERDIGVELRMRLAEPLATRFIERWRYLAGPTGCGLCGIESLGEAMRTPSVVSDDVRFTPSDIMRAVDAVTLAQSLHRQTFAVHGAAFYDPAKGLVALREDVGRHNALDKLSGALAGQGHSGANGIGIVTSRLSVEMIQKAAAIQLPVLVAGFGTDGARGPHRGCGRHHAGRGRAQGRLRDFHSRPSRRRRGERECRLTSSSTWPTRSASSSRARTRPRLRRQSLST